MEFKADNGSTIEINATQHPILSVLFAEDGKQVWSCGREMMFRRWRVDDGHEVSEPIREEETEFFTAALSPDGKWLVYGLRFPGKAGEPKAWAAVWDARTNEKVRDIEGHTDTVFSVDISPESTRFATGSGDGSARIWDVSTGQLRVGPLMHDGWVLAVRFSPSGDRIATATAFKENESDTNSKLIRIYDSENGQLLLDIPFRFRKYLSTERLTWSADGRHLFAASFGEVYRFDASSGSVLSKWTVSGGAMATSVILSHNQKFAVVVADHSLSFWDASTQTRFGPTVQHQSPVNTLTVSPCDDCIATGEDGGKITIRGLRDILPASYFTIDLPFLSVSSAVFKSWTQGDLTTVEKLLERDIIHPSSPLHHACTLAQRALVRTRLKQWDVATDDAKNSIKIQRSVIGHIAVTITRAGSGERELAMHTFDLAFGDGLARQNRFLSLIKAIILFQCGKHNNAVSRVDRLVDMAIDRSVYITVRAYMHFILGSMSLRRGDQECATESFGRAREAVPVRNDHHLQVISLIFGWDFDNLARAGPDIVQKGLACERKGDAAMRSKAPEQAIAEFSAAMSLYPWQPVDLLVKRSKAQAMNSSWEDALKDADEVIRVDPASPDGYERRHVALHALQRYDEAFNAFARMFSLIEESPDPGIRLLGKKYISPSESKAAVESAIRGVIKTSPLVLIDVKSGCLCDGIRRTDIFKSEPEFKELLSSITDQLDDERIQRAVDTYFRYVTLSHVWEGKEPSFQDVTQCGSVWELNTSSPLHQKLQKFCEVVRADGYRWAWSDTACIDKTVSTVLNQSLKMMYLWYEASAATFVFLRDIHSLSAVISLKDTVWMTRAWTSQELLSPKVVRFYTQRWRPYLGDTRANHKDSPEIMQELANAIGVARETIIAFNPDDLSVREKLRLASTRNATVEEDIAYSLIGIFKSDIRPDYGEGYAALGHLLEEVVARSGEVTVLDWIGKSSPYNSCLPASLAVYSRPPTTSPAIDDVEMEARVAALRASLSQADAIRIHDQITRLPPARFANRRLHLPCIIFTVRKLGVDDFGDGHVYRYRARVSGMGNVEFQTSDKLPLKDARKLVFVHPWIRDLRDPYDGYTGSSIADKDEDDEEEDEDNESVPDSEAGSAPPSPLHPRPAATMDEYTRALRLIVRLQRPFHALLLQQQPNGEFKRVATKHEIVVPGIERGSNLAKDVCTDTVEIL